MDLNWRLLYCGHVSAHEVKEAINDDEWQELRISMKGASLDEKYSKLTAYRALKVAQRLSNSEMRKVDVRITNYITALSRGGLIKPSDYR